MIFLEFKQFYTTLSTIDNNNNNINKLVFQNVNGFSFVLLFKLKLNYL